MAQKGWSKMVSRRQSASLQPVEEPRSGFADLRPELIEDLLRLVGSTPVIPVNARVLTLISYLRDDNHHLSQGLLAARLLREMGVATLLIRAATTPVPGPPMSSHADRLVMAAERLLDPDDFPELRIGCFAMGSTASGALGATERKPNLFHSMVLRGWRADTDCSCLPRILVPTLLIAPGLDDDVARRNRIALNQIGAREKRLEIVPGAKSEFTEPGALETATILAGRWMIRCTDSRSGAAGASPRTAARTASGSRSGTR